MARLTIYFGIVLIGIGIFFFVTTGSAHPTSLIPCWFGLVLGVCGAMANSKDASKRMLYMHIAVTIGLLGFVFPGFMAMKDILSAHSTHAPMPHPSAVHEQLLMSILCFFFVVLCVRSFIAARRARLV
ncbi:MAG: hypothetical protein HIU91_00315 [Acidobacteria bacterium]|nr:hypothetical protein [Acidobacteriota bacterium]